MPSLYEIDGALLRMMEESVDPETGEFCPDQEAWDRLQLEWKVKIENTALHIKDLEGDIAKYKAELKSQTERLTAVIRAMEKKADWLKGNLTRSLEGQRFQTPRCDIRFRKSEAVTVTDETATINWAKEFAPDVLRYKPVTLSLADLKAEMKKGTEIPGAELTGRTNISIR